MGLNINMDFIFRVAELVLLVVGLTLFMIPDTLISSSHESKSIRASDAMVITGSIYLIILAIVLGIKLIKSNDLDQTFMGVLSTIGAILLIATGVCVCIYAKNSTEEFLISGIMSILAGVALVVDALKDFSVF